MSRARRHELGGDMKVRFFGVLAVLVAVVGCNQQGASQQGGPAGETQGTTTSETAPAATMPSTGNALSSGGGPGVTSGATAAQSAANPVRDQAPARPPGVARSPEFQEG